MFLVNYIHIRSDSRNISATLNDFLYAAMLSRNYNAADWPLNVCLAFMHDT